jgi:hypothetical protein
VHRRVNDASGAIVIGAEVEIKNPGTNEAVTRTSATISSIRAVRPSVELQVFVIAL